MSAEQSEESFRAAAATANPRSRDRMSSSNSTAKSGTTEDESNDEPDYLIPLPSDGEGVDR